MPIIPLLFRIRSGPQDPFFPLHRIVARTPPRIAVAQRIHPRKHLLKRRSDATDGLAAQAAAQPTHQRQAGPDELDVALADGAAELIFITVVVDGGEDEDEAGAFEEEGVVVEALMS